MALCDPPLDLPLHWTKYAEHESKKKEVCILDSVLKMNERQLRPICVATKTGSFTQSHRQQELIELIPRARAYFRLDTEALK